MKIPETSANVGAYYGNEENGQWQPNGVIIDSGVGGGVVGSGDAGIHRPVYPMHIPRGHVSGYVMAGAYYGAAGGGVGAGAAYAQGPPPEDFSDYMWMENEEEFDKQVMQQLEEEALMEQCIEAMLEDEQRERHRPSGGQNHPTTSNGTSLSLEETVSRSTLNPLAAEFVPTRRPHSTDDKTEPPSSEVPTEPTEEHKTDTETHTPDDAHTEEPPSPPAQDPPEVSAADIQPDKTRKDSKRQDSKKQDIKKTVKLDSKKKPQTTKSDTKVQPKKKEAVKAVKSEGRVSDVTPPPATVQAPAPAVAVAPAPVVDPAPVSVSATAPAPATEVAKPTPAPVEEPPAGPKPINYAAAAKANKPKKAPTIENTPPPMEKPRLPADKQKPKEKTERPTAAKDKVQRKNSAK